MIKNVGLVGGDDFKDVGEICVIRCVYRVFYD